MLSPIAVEDMELTFLPFLEPEWEVQTPASQNVKIDGKGVYSGAITIKLTGGIPPVGTFISAEPIVLTPTAQFVKVDGELVLRQLDQVTGVAKIQPSSSSSPVDLPYTCVVANAGQTSIQGD